MGSRSEDRRGADVDVHGGTEDLIVSVDPGLHGCGFALFVGGKLEHAEYTGGLGGQIHTLLEPVEPVEDIVREIVTGLDRKIDLAIVERPVVRDTAKQIGEQGSIIRLAMVAGALLDRMSTYARAALDLTPEAWKGQVKKDVMCRRIEKKLEPGERKVVQLPKAAKLQHNVWDGIGLGLWRLGRIGK